MVIKNVKNKQLLDMKMIEKIIDETIKLDAEQEDKTVGRRYASVIIRSYGPYPCIEKCKTD